MNRLFWMGFFLTLTFSKAFSQGGLALYDTYDRYSSAVFSVEVEIPQDHIMQRYETHLESFKEYHESLLSDITGQSSHNLTYQQFESFFTNIEQKMNSLKDHLLINNRVKGIAFAVDQHHLVTISTVVRSATLGGDVYIGNHSTQNIPAKVLNIDSHTGVAVIRVNEVTFEHTVPLEDNSWIPPASYILSIQRPFDMPASPVAGMVGGYYRKLNLFPLEKYIQTDIPLYPGNEGAPVFSPSGRLVGMIATEFHVGQSPGVTFVIPAEYIVNSANEIIETGFKQRGKIPGVQIQLGENGIEVLNVAQSSPYQKDLQKGDLIIGLDRAHTNNLMQIWEAIINTKPNQTLQLMLLRDNAKVEVSVQTQQIH